MKVGYVKEVVDHARAAQRRYISVDGVVNEM